MIFKHSKPIQPKLESITVIGQLTGRFNKSNIWAIKMRTLSGRLSRKVLAHGLSMLANTLLRNKQLQLEQVIFKSPIARA